MLAFPETIPDALRAVLVLGIGLLAFAFLRVGISQLINRDAYKENHQLLVGNFWGNLLGRNPQMGDPLDMASGGHYNLKKKRLVQTGQLPHAAVRRGLWGE